MKIASIVTCVLFAAATAEGQCWGPGALPWRTPVRTAQVAFAAPEGMFVQWDVTRPGQYDSTPLVTPGRQEFAMGYGYALKLSRLPGRYGVELYGSLEVFPVTWRKMEYLAHSAIRVEITEEEIDAVLAGKMVSKVIRLPQEDIEGPPESGNDAVLAVLRLGNRFPRPWQ